MEIMDTIKKEIPSPEQLGSTLPPKKINQELKQIVSLYGEKKKEINSNYENVNSKLNFSDYKEQNNYLNSHHHNNKINDERNSSISVGEKNGLNHNYLSNNKKITNGDRENYERYNLVTPVMKERKISEGEQLNLNVVKDLNLDGFLESWQAPPQPTQEPLENNPPSMLYYQPKNKLNKYNIKISIQCIYFFQYSIS